VISLQKDGVLNITSELLNERIKPQQSLTCPYCNKPVNQELIPRTAPKVFLVDITPAQGYQQLQASSNKNWSIHQTTVAATITLFGKKYVPIWLSLYSGSNVENNTTVLGDEVPHGHFTSMVYVEGISEPSWFRIDDDKYYYFGGKDVAISHRDICNIAFVRINDEGQDDNEGERIYYSVDAALSQAQTRAEPPPISLGRRLEATPISDSDDEQAIVLESSQQQSSCRKRQNDSRENDPFYESTSRRSDQSANRQGNTQETPTTRRLTIAERVHRQHAARRERNRTLTTSLSNQESSVLLTGAGFPSAGKGENFSTYNREPRFFLTE
jgi:hypothetical protein